MYSLLLVLISSPGRPVPIVQLRKQTRRAIKPLAQGLMASKVADPEGQARLI